MRIIRTVILKWQIQGSVFRQRRRNIYFERFYRVDKSHSREIGGTGLGLAIARSAVVMHRGAIKVFSQPSEGTTFTVRISRLNYVSLGRRRNAMIKKKSYWILMLTAICILAVTGCKKEGKTADFHIYYTDSEGVSLVEKGIKPEGKTQKEQIDEILDKIQKNTDDIDYRSPFVKEVKVKEWSVKDGKLIVDFNRNYQKLSATEEILLRAAVVQSVGQISGVDAVLFMIDGESLQDMNGQVVGYMQPSDFVKNTGVSLHSYQKETFLLYYGNKQGDRLVKEKVSIRYNSSISKEKVLVEQLIKGPSSDNETAVIPAETKVLSVSVKDHICYVNLDKGFLDTTNVMNPELPVYAIVNTIIEGSSIGRVQILIDGKKPNVNYMGKISLEKAAFPKPEYCGRGVVREEQAAS